MSLADYLVGQRVAFEQVLHAPAFCARRRAKYLKVPVRFVADATLVVGPEGPIVVVMPLPFELDLERIALLLGSPVRLATRQEVTATFRDCEWGVVSPFGNLYGLPTLLDTHGDPEDPVIVPGLTLTESVWLRWIDLERLTGAFRAEVARLPAQGCSRGDAPGHDEPPLQGSEGGFPEF